MSHVVGVKVEFKELEMLKEAFSILGLEYRAKTSYNWYGSHQGDYPLPAGTREEDLGKCDFAFGVPGDPDAYEVGVIKRGSQYHFLFDFWGPQGAKLERHIGKEGQHLRAAGDRGGTGRLVQSYTAAVTERHYRAKGYETSRAYNDAGDLEVRVRVTR